MEEKAEEADKTGEASSHLASFFTSRASSFISRSRAREAAVSTPSGPPLPRPSKQECSS